MISSNKITINNDQEILMIASTLVCCFEKHRDKIRSKKIKIQIKSHSSIITYNNKSLEKQINIFI